MSIDPTTPARPPLLRRSDLIVLGIALVARGVWAGAVPVVPTSDSVVYDLLAQNLAAGLGYAWQAGEPTMYWPVGPSFLFSVCFRLFGHTYAPIVGLNIALGLVSVGLTMALARRWFGPAVGTVAGLLMAVWPWQVEFVTILGSESPFLALMLGAWWASESDRLPWLARAALVGVLIAGACFMRPTGLLLPGVFALGRLAQRGSVVKVAAELGITLAVLAACIAPWALRNQSLFGAPVLISANGGANTWMGNNPETNGFYADLPARVNGLSELERDRLLGGEAKAFIRADPVGFVRRSLVKLVRLHERESIGVVWNAEGLAQRFPARAIQALKLFSNLGWWAILAGGLAGLVVLLRERGVLATLFHPAVLVWGYFAGVHAATVIQDRYHYPIAPSVAALAGLALIRLRAPRRRSAAAPPVAPATATATATAVRS